MGRLETHLFELSLIKYIQVRRFFIEIDAWVFWEQFLIFHVPPDSQQFAIVTFWHLKSDQELADSCIHKS
jgi:hypothetical protein